MSTSDGNSTTRPLRRRQSKRFDRSARSSVVAGSSVISADDVDDVVDDDVEFDLPDPADEEAGDDAVTEAEAEVAVAPYIGTDPDSTPDPEDGSEPVEAAESPDSVDAVDSTETVDADAARPERRSTVLPIDAEGTNGTQADPAAARSRTLDQMTACGRCGHDVSTVNIEVDGNVLMMESCDNCDTRRWQLAGEPIELQQALDHVGEHTGRRR